MLRGIHKASSNWIGRAIMGVVLGLIAISFGIWGIGDIFRGFGTNTVAKVGSTEIRLDTFRQLYQDRIQQIGRQLNRPILPDQARALGLDRQLLNEIIAETAMDEQARAMRLNVSDADLARRITDAPDFKPLSAESPLVATWNSWSASGNGIGSPALLCGLLCSAPSSV